MDVSRKRFVEALLGGSALLLFHGCGGGGDTMAIAGNPMPTSGCGAVIADNHGHILSIAVADLDSTMPKTYDIHGNADHGHNVTFSVAQLQQLKAGQMVTVTSTETLAHMHQVSVSCIVP